MQIDGMERHFIGEPEAHHDHARYPEKQNIVACFEHSSRIVARQISRLFRPAKRAERPQTAAEPGIEHVFFLPQMSTAAGGAAGRVGTLDGDMAVFAVEGRDAVSPPQLTADTPITDVLQPVEIGLFKAIRHDPDLAIAHGGHGFIGQRLNTDKPLFADHRLDNFATALTAGHDMGKARRFDRQSGSGHIRPQLFACGVTFHAGVGAAVLVQASIAAHEADHRQVVTLGHFVIVEVMRWRDFERACAERRIDRFVSNHRDRAIGYRHIGGLADQVFEAFIIRMHGHCRIAEDRFRAGGRHGQHSAAFDRVIEKVERRFFFGSLHFQIADCGLQAWRPVDQPWAAIDQPLFPERHKGFAHGLRQRFVEREALPIPIDAGAQPSQLVIDAAAVFLLPFPGTGQERLPPDSFAAGAFRTQ